MVIRNYAPCVAFASVLQSGAELIALLNDHGAHYAPSVNAERDWLLYGGREHRLCCLAMGLYKGCSQPAKYLVCQTNRMQLLVSKW